MVEAGSLVRNITRNTEIRGTPLPPEFVRIVAAGGMTVLLKQQASNKKTGGDHG